MATLAPDLNSSHHRRRSSARNSDADIHVVDPATDNETTAKELAKEDNAAIRQMQDELAAISRSFQQGEMMAFGRESEAVFANLDRIRRMQEGLALEHAAMEMNATDIFSEAERRGQSGPEADHDANGSLKDRLFKLFEQDEVKITSLMDHLDNVRVELEKLHGAIIDRK